MSTKLSFCAKRFSFSTLSLNTRNIKIFVSSYILIGECKPRSPPPHAIMLGSLDGDFGTARFIVIVMVCGGGGWLLVGGWWRMMKKRTKI